MSRLPDFSVVVPAYNTRPAYLTECISSIQRAAAHYRPEAVSIVVVDDGSNQSNSMKYREIVERHGTRSVETRLLRHHRNLGIAAARNTGVKASQAEWILLVDSDDAVRPDTFAVVSSTLSAGTLLAFTAHQKLDEGLSLEIETRRKAVYHRLLQQHAGTVRDPFLHYTFLIHMHIINRRLYDAIGGFDTSIDFGDEIDFHLRATERFSDPHYYQYIDEVVYTYRENGSGVCADASKYRKLISNIEKIMLAHGRRRGLNASRCTRAGKQPDGAVSYHYEYAE